MKAHLIDQLRGAFENGLTDEDTRALVYLSDWTGLHIVNVWAYVDEHGCGGDSELYVKLDDRFVPAPDRICGFLLDSEDTTPVEGLKNLPFGGDGPILHVLTEYNQYHYAIEDRRDVDVIEESVTDVKALYENVRSPITKHVTLGEFTAIAGAINDFYGFYGLEVLDGSSPAEFIQFVIKIESFMSDGPGYTGDVFVILYTGGPQLVDIVTGSHGVFNVQHIETAPHQVDAQRMAEHVEEATYKIADALQLLRDIYR